MCHSLPIEEPSAADRLDALEEALLYKFRDRGLLTLALTHESFANEHDSKELNNERLEFLGDSILGGIICLYLYTHLPNQPEGVMAKIKSHVASTQFLAAKALEINLGSYLRLGHGEDSVRGRTRANILADAMEAVIGAIYLDGGFEPAQRFVLSKLSTAMDAMEGAHCDYKSLLQEVTQRFFHDLPRYVTVGESGPDHDRSFQVEVLLGDKSLGIGEGPRKKEAGQIAAEQAYALLNGILGYDLHLCPHIDVGKAPEEPPAPAGASSKPAAMVSEESCQLAAGECPSFMLPAPAPASQD